MGPRVSIFALAAVVGCGELLGGSGNGPAEGDAGPEASTEGGTSGVCAEAEMPWAEPDAGATQVACDGTLPVDLLVSRQHCGRCGRSCGEQTCVDGTCTPRPEAAADGILTRDEAALYLNAGNVIVRFEVGKTTALGSIPGPDDSTPVAASTDSAFLFVRSRYRLYKTEKLAPAPFLGITPYATFDPWGGIAASGVELAVSSGSEGKIYAFDKNDGGRRTLVETTDTPRAIDVNGARMVWLEEPWLQQRPAGGAVKVDRNGAVSTLFADAGQLTSMVVSESDVYVARVQDDAGSIMRVGLDASASVFSAEPEANLVNLSFVAVDATHVYWTRVVETSVRYYYDVVKRARCGGATVRLMSRVYFPQGLAVFGDRVYVSSNGQLLSVPR